MRFSSTTGARPMDSEPIPRPLRRLGVRMVIGAACGAPIGYLLGWTHALDGFKHWSPENLAGMLLAALMLATALIVGWAGTSPARMRRLAGPRDAAEPLDANALLQARKQALVLLATGVALAIPPLAQELGWSDTIRQAGLAGIVALTLFSGWQTFALWRASDELARAVIVSAGAATYFLAGTALFLWASAAKMALLPDLGSWAVMLAFTVCSLVCSVTLQIRRGMLPD